MGLLAYMGLEGGGACQNIGDDVSYNLWESIMGGYLGIVENHRERLKHHMETKPVSIGV